MPKQDERRVGSMELKAVKTSIRQKHRSFCDPIQIW